VRHGMPKADNRNKNKCKPITEIVLIDATQIATLKHQREFINSIEAHRFNWGFGSGKSHCGVDKTIIKKMMMPNVNCAYYLPTYGLQEIAIPKFTSQLILTV
jgi:hypothetical protein